VTKWEAESVLNGVTGLADGAPWADQDQSRSICARTTGLAIPFEIYARKEPSSVLHIITVLVSEGLAHHPLFAWRANKIHERKRHERVPAGQPVLQEKTLRQTQT